MKEATKTYRFDSCNGCPFTYRTMETEICNHPGIQGKGVIRYSTVFLEGCPLPDVVA